MQYVALYDESHKKADEKPYTVCVELFCSELFGQIFKTMLKFFGRIRAIKQGEKMLPCNIKCAVRNIYNVTSLVKLRQLFI